MPVIVVSIDGLTLHLWDRQGTFDKVYPIGPGAVENGKSLTLGDPECVDGQDRPPVALHDGVAKLEQWWRRGRVAGTHGRIVSLTRASLTWSSQCPLMRR